MVRVISPIIESGDRVREGKGFSRAELEAAEVIPSEATSLGIPYDKRRKSCHNDNIELLKDYINEAREVGIRFSVHNVTRKTLPGRVFRGKTSAGQRMRNLNRARAHHK